MKYNRRKPRLPMNTLLQAQQNRHRRRNHRLAIITAALGVMVMVYWGFFRSDEIRTDEEIDIVAIAQWAVSDSLDIAYYEIMEDQPVIDEPVDDEPDIALEAVWEEGQAVFMRGEIAPGHSVGYALQQRNISPVAIHNVVQATEKEFNFRRSRPGDRWSAQVNEDGVIEVFTYQTSPVDIWMTSRQEDGSYDCVKEDIVIEMRQEVVAGVVKTSLWHALEASGESGNLAQSFIKLFSGVVDFSTETRTGDRFALVFEKEYLNGEFLRYGRILAAKYIGRSGPRLGFYFESDNTAGYYDADGDSLQRQFMRSPVPGARLTSRFGPRYHPVLKVRRMHNGVDYGAPTGTPIYAAADGLVTFAGWRGANGKLIVIRHGGGYETYYAHLSSFARGIRRGKRVSRGDRIGNVGSTGRSTGPHLHYGMKRHGRYLNPLTVDSARGEPLKRQELKIYTSTVVEPLLEKLRESIKTVDPIPDTDLLQAGEIPEISPG